MGGHLSGSGHVLVPFCGSVMRKQHNSLRLSPLFFLLQGLGHAALHNAQRLPVQSASADAPAGWSPHRLAHAEWQASVRHFQNAGHDN